jgi:hypothetical protein
MKYYISGSTIKLKCTFTNFEDNLIDPDVVKFIVYDYKFNKINEYILNSSNKISEGIYFYNFTTPNEESLIYYEFKGEIQGTIAIERGSIRTKFII